MIWADNGIAAHLVGKLGELATSKESGSPEFRLRQAIREYNALLNRTDPTRPAGSACISCRKSDKLVRRKERHDLIRNTEQMAVLETNPAKKEKLMESADRLHKDMDRVEDARLALHVYTANEDPAKQEDFLKDLRDKPPPGFEIASLHEVAADFGVDADKLQKLVRNKDNPSQKITFYVRDQDVVGFGPKYTVSFRGSTSDARDWNNNGLNEAGFEAPHQKGAARLGRFLKAGAKEMGLDVDALISATGHSKGASEAQAFAAAMGSFARIFNAAGYNLEQYAETAGIDLESIRIDRTSVIQRDQQGKALRSSDYTPRTDPLYYAQHEGLTRFIMKKPMKTGAVRELAPIDPNLSVPSKEQSETEAHSMLQVIEALERDKKADQDALEDFVRRGPV